MRIFGVSKIFVLCPGRFDAAPSAVTAREVPIETAQAPKPLYPTTEALEASIREDQNRDVDGPQTLQLMGGVLGWGMVYAPSPPNLCHTEAG